MYRLYTEDVNARETRKIISARFDGFTLLKADGYYKGDCEKSLVVEIETEDEENVYALAREIKHANGQESVLVESIPTKGVLI